jgi:hypothetical protein
VNAAPAELRWGVRRRPALRRGKVSRVVLVPVVVSGVAAAVLLAVCLAYRWSAARSEAPAGESAAAAADDLPAHEDLELAAASDKAAGLGRPSLKTTLSAITDAVAARAPLLDDPALVSLMTSPGGPWGDQRRAGAAAPEDARPGRNWEIHFVKGNTLESYARQLDFFGIELAVVMPDNKLLYASGFSQPKPQTRTAAADQEQRYYLTWRDTESQQADRELLARVGIRSQGRIVLKILPAAIEGKLADLEKRQAGRQAGSVGKTAFGIRAEGNGYAFYVVEQVRLK